MDWYVKKETSSWVSEAETKETEKLCYCYL